MIDVDEALYAKPVMRDRQPCFVCEDCEVRIVLEQVATAEQVAKEHRDMTDHESYETSKIGKPTDRRNDDG